MSIDIGAMLAKHVADQLQPIIRDLHMLKTAYSRMVKVGPVEEIDAEKGYRIKLGEGEDGQPYLSPWLGHPETGKTSIPLKKGQIVGVVNPGGDPRQGFIIRNGYSDEHKSPNSDMEANVFEDAGIKLTIAGGALTVVAGGVTAVISGSGVAVTGGQVTHNGINIGSTHEHTGVVHGGDLTGPPVG